jgi:hypothetical protein
VEKAVADWLEEGLPGRTVKTVEANRHSLRPLLEVIGRIPLKDLSVQDVRTALKKMAATHSTRTLQKGHNCYRRELRPVITTGGRGHGPDLRVEAAANKHRNYCWMKNPSKRVERNKRVKLAPVRLIVRRRDDNQWCWLCGRVAGIPP